MNSPKLKVFSRESDVNIVGGKLKYIAHFSDFEYLATGTMRGFVGLFLFQKLIIILIEFMERKNTILPTLAASKPKSRITRDKLKIEELLLNNTTNRMTHQDYRCE